MKFIFSPSKGMDFIKKRETKEDCILSDKSQELLKNLTSKSIKELGQLLKIKGELLEKTYDIYNNYSFYEKKEAILMYNGVSFKELTKEKFTSNEMDFIKNNVFILSAFYGILDGTQMIKPYRLDMTHKVLEVSPYKFWTNVVNDTLSKFSQEVIVNLASSEFSKIIDEKKFNIINIIFMIKKDVSLKKSHSNEAKKMRGKFLNKIIFDKVDTIEKLKDIQIDNYCFSREKSDENNLIFIKEE